MANCLIAFYTPFFLRGGDYGGEMRLPVGTCRWKYRVLEGNTQIQVQCPLHVCWMMSNYCYPLILCILHAKNVVQKRRKL